MVTPMSSYDILDAIDPSDTFDTLQEWEIDPVDYTGDIPAIPDTTTSHPDRCPCIPCDADRDAATYHSKEHAMPDQAAAQTYVSTDVDDQGTFDLNLSAEEYETLMWALELTARRGGKRAADLHVRLIASSHVDPAEES